MQLRSISETFPSNKKESMVVAPVIPPETGRTVEGIFSPAEIAGISNLWKKRCPILRQNGIGLFDTRNGDAQVIVVGKSRAYQILKVIVPEHLPPGKISSR